RKIESQPPETIATRPIETPVDSGPRKSEAPAPSAAWRWLVAAAAVGLIGGGALWLERSGGGTASPPSTPASATAGTTPSTSTSSPAPSVSVVTQAVTPVVPAPSASSEAKVSAHLALFGDPGTRAIVDGTPRGACPIPDLTVEPGDHEVRFVFDMTGDSSGTRVTVKPGQHLRLRADFTGATPTVRVQR
ncbi:MAG TPA: hypothetical protein VLM85_13460, partial [Polyangiaceae bacterium]|nr:hypothetical protein [Polyangiaceae bacterium]